MHMQSGPCQSWLLRVPPSPRPLEPRAHHLPGHRQADSGETPARGLRQTALFPQATGCCSFSFSFLFRKQHKIVYDTHFEYSSALLQHTERQFQNNSASVIHNSSSKFVVFSYSYPATVCPQISKRTRKKTHKMQKITQALQ